MDSSPSPTSRPHTAQCPNPDRIFLQDGPEGRVGGREDEKEGRRDQALDGARLKSKALSSDYLEYTQAILLFLPLYDLDKSPSLYLTFGIQKWANALMPPIEAVTRINHIS